MGGNERTRKLYNRPFVFSFASGGQGALFEKTAPWTPAKTFY
jgi:hypothetical protein